MGRPEKRNDDGYTLAIRFKPLSWPVILTLAMSCGCMPQHTSGDALLVADGASSGDLKKNKHIKTEKPFSKQESSRADPVE